MIRQSSRRGRLDALLHDNNFQAPAAQTLAQILRPCESNNPANGTLSHPDLAKALASAKEINQYDYLRLLQYLTSMGKQYYSAHSEIPHAPGTRILPPVGQMPPQISYEGRTYSCGISHVGNSHIQFYIPNEGGRIATGQIEAIWRIPLENVWQTFLLVQQHRPLTAIQLRRSPYAQEPCSKLQATIIDSEPSTTFMIIEPRHIICHLAVFKNPLGTYGIRRETMTISWALNRRCR